MAIGAYAVERDYSHYVAYLSKTILAIVGTATKGPINVATACTSAQDFVNKFGPLKENYYGLYAGQYFLNQASRIYFVRAASNSAAVATTEVAGENSSSTVVSDAITIALKEKGTYGNGYSVVIAAGTATSSYNITVKNAAGNVLESLKNVSLESLTSSTTTYSTNYITVSEVNSTAASLTAGTYTFSGGNDGVSNIAAADYLSAANVLKADNIDINLISVPGQSDPAVVAGVLTIAETRGDCLYLVDPPKGLTVEGVIQWSTGSGTYEHTAFNSSYGALYYDWVEIYDSVNKVKVVVPPSVPVAASIAYSDRMSELWYAPAGLTRGLVRGVLKTETQLNKSDVDLLYESGNINALYEDPQVGLVLWGQKTLYKEDSALNRINVRRMMNYLKKIVVAACNYLTFEPNDRMTWNSFEMKIQPVLNSIRSNRGIYEYSIIKGDTIVNSDDIDNYRMPCMIMIRPTKSAEEIPVYFVITSTGADFNEVLEANGVVTEE